MSDLLLLSLITIGLIIVGVAIFWAFGRASSNDRVATANARSSVVRTIGWTLGLVGLFAAVGLLASILFVPAWIILAVVLVSLLYRYRSVERRSLLWILMLAAERNIPLETAARAFAAERHDMIGRRALDLAEYLEAGLPLALALKRSRLHFPQAILLSAELGQQTGDLGEALRRALGQANESEVVLRSAAERLFYLVCVVSFGAIILTFMLLKIVPAFCKIFDEFGMELPVATQWLTQTGYVFFNYMPLILLVAAVVLIYLVRSLAYYSGCSPRYLPGLLAGWQRADRNVILHWLAHAVRQNRPLPEMMRLISGYLTKRRLRNRLQRSARRIDQGLEWTECLQEANLIRKPEAAVFRAAERTGNLAWALEEMAESNARRSVYRLRALGNAAFPTTILALGCLVFLVALGLIGPLFKLISGLS